jgi:hypothetical protein
MLKGIYICFLISLRFLTKILQKSNSSVRKDRLWPATSSPISTDPSPLLSIDFHVAHSPSLPILIQLVVFNWWLSLQPPTHAGSSLADFSTLKMEAIRSSETAFHTRSTRRHIPEDGILHSYRRENLKSYINCM